MSAVKKSPEDKAGGGRIVQRSTTRAAGAPGMVMVTVAGPGHITHHGRLYKAGQTVELPAEVAAGLVDAGLATKG
jgi:hypothetical protein